MPKPGLERLRQDDYFRALDYWLLVPVLCITLIGLSALNDVLKTGTTYPMSFYRQVGAVVLGVLCALSISLLEVPMLRIMGFAVYGASILLLFLVRFTPLGFDPNGSGSQSWLSLPVVGSFQPSELSKAGLAMVSAYILEAIRLNRFGRHNRLKGFALLAGACAPIIGLIALQPDFGTAMVITIMLAVMVFAWGIRLRFVLLALSGAVVAVPVVFTAVLKPYQQNRILTFLFPAYDPDATFHVTQSRLAIQSGGILGNPNGLTVYVPEQESDFIFTAVAEKTGLVGCAALFILVFFFIARCFYIASKVRRTSSSLMIAGLASVLAFHYIENLGMCVGLLPITGIPLPYMSYGGTAMIVSYLSLGVMLCVSMDRSLTGKT
ncbi:MAG: rod shape-determining protein RodA [Clostridia bacterium]|nr:rod shape-determining protein RodA [Clostridia bacterium]